MEGQVREDGRCEEWWEGAYDGEKVEGDVGCGQRGESEEEGRHGACFRWSCFDCSMTLITIRCRISDCKVCELALERRPCIYTRGHSDDLPEPRDRSISATMARLALATDRRSQPAGSDVTPTLVWFAGFPVSCQPNLCGWMDSNK